MYHSRMAADSIHRVQAALARAGLPTTTHRYEAGIRTVADAAASIGVAEGQIVKALIYRTESGEPVLALMSGPNLLDEAKLAALLGEPVHRPDAEYVRGVTGFSIGAVPPVGHRQPLRTLIDADLWHFDELWASAGTQRDAFRITADQLQSATRGQRAEMRRAPTPPGTSPA